MANSTAMAAQGQIALISARLERLPTTRYIWTLLLLLSLGGCFEFYDLFLMTYIGPGLIRSGLFSAGSASFLSLTSLASFVSATFAGLPLARWHSDLLRTDSGGGRFSRIRFSGTRSARR